MNKLRSRKFIGLLSLVAVGLFPVSGLAQTTDTTTDKSGTTTLLPKYVVTGSNIPTTLTAAEAGAFPLISLDRPTIEKTGYQNAAELLQKLTVNNSGAIAISNNATGFTPAATSVSLRGLGPEATLVLINGHRVAPYPVGQNGDTAFVDLNTIPLGMIERIEVLKDGASAVYGADAVAGVVNIILRKNYSGSEVHVQYQNTTNKDASQLTVTALTGVSSDKGSITVGFNYQRQNPIFNRDRSYSAVPAFLSSNSSPINAELSVLAYDEALGLPAGTDPTGLSGRATFKGTPGPLTSDGLPTSSTNHGNVAPSDWHYSAGNSSIYNYNQDSGSFPSWTRYGMILNGERKLFGSKNLTGYFDGNYQHSETVNQLAPSATGNFATPGQTTLVIPARTANPILTIINNSDGSAMQVTAGSALPSGYRVGAGTTLDASGNVQRIAAAGAYNPFNPFNQDISGATRFRTKEFGNRIFDDSQDAFMGTIGIRGEDIADKFNFDAGLRYSEINFHGNDTLVSSSKFNDVLNANSALLLNNGISTPYNPFGYYANPIAANAAVTALGTVHTHDTDMSSIGNTYLNLNTGHLFEIPGGGVGAALGFDYRVERLTQSPDTENHLGDVIGSSPAAITDHTRSVGAVYAELNFPIASPAQNIPGLYSLEVNVAGRYEDFFTSHDHAAVPKIGVGYKPFDDSLLIRASASRGFLEPSMYKLYSGPISALLGLTDPRTGDELTETPIVSQGNPNLKAEKSKAYTAGVVWTPKKSFLKGFTANVDFWRVERDGTALINQQDTLDRWNGQDAFGNPAPGGLLPGEQVIQDAAGDIVQVVALYRNAGLTIADGVDFGGSYLLETETMGRFDIAAGMSYLHSYRQASVPGAPLDELVDTTQDGEGQDAILKRKARADFTWTYKSWQANIAGNFLDGFQNYDTNGDPYRTGSSWTFDVRLSYTLHDQFGAYLKDTKIIVGSKNVLNRHPPLSQFFGANPDNYPGFIYTSEDREVYVALDKKF